jgi:hypothetical protein
MYELTFFRIHKQEFFAPLLGRLASFEEGLCAESASAPCKPREAKGGVPTALREIKIINFIYHHSILALT